MKLVIQHSPTLPTQLDYAFTLLVVSWHLLGKYQSSFARKSKRNIPLVRWSNRAGKYKYSSTLRCRLLTDMLSFCKTTVAQE